LNETSAAFEAARQKRNGALWMARRFLFFDLEFLRAFGAPRKVYDIGN
jgi:hypothetical protein